MTNRIQKLNELSSKEITRSNTLKRIANLEGHIETMKAYTPWMRKYFPGGVRGHLDSIKRQQASLSWERKNLESC